MAAPSDPTQLEVLKNALEGIADGMALTVVRTSRSPVVRQSLDFSTGLLSAGGELVGQGLCIPTHLGGMPVALQACIDRYGDRIYPGDILANNDPYEGGSHLPDIFLYKPMFVGDRLVGFGCAMTHHIDIGGRVPGGNACDNTEIFQEGLRIPPLKLYQEGQPNETLFRILEKAVRVPDMVLADIMSNVAALHFGEQQYMKLADQFGPEELVGAIEELLDYTERLTREGIRSLPDGTWSFTDYLDDDGFDPSPIAIVSNLTKKGDGIHVDFTGTSPQVKGSIQPVLATTKAAVYAVVRCILGAVEFDIPNTAGYFRPVTVTAPEGTFVNPLPPAPVAARTMGNIRIYNSLYGAFAQMLPDKVFACAGGCELGLAMAGYHKDRTPWKPWVQTEFHNEQAVGGFPYKDGQDAQPAGTTQVANCPVEVLEAEQPIRVEQYAFTQDTEGAGKFRGGCGMLREYTFLQDDTVLQVRADRMKHPPYGLEGGYASAPTRITLTQGGVSKLTPSKFLTTVNKGDKVQYAWPGAGGWGDPLERDPELVLEDVTLEKVSAERARDVYGVVVDPGTRRVDYAATQRLRASLQGRRDASKR